MNKDAQQPLVTDRNSKDDKNVILCVSPILKTSIVEKSVKKLNKKYSVIHSPDLSKSKNDKSKKRIGISDRLTRIKQKIIGNDDTDKTFDNVRVIQPENCSFGVQDLLKKNCLSDVRSCSVLAEECFNSVSETYCPPVKNSICSDKTEVLDSPVLIQKKFFNLKRLRSRKSVRKKLFSNSEKSMRCDKISLCNSYNENDIFCDELNAKSTRKPLMSLGIDNNVLKTPEKNDLCGISFETSNESDYLKVNNSPVIKSQPKINSGHRRIPLNKFMKTLTGIFPERFDESTATEASTLGNETEKNELSNCFEQDCSIQRVGSVTRTTVQDDSDVSKYKNSNNINDLVFSSTKVVSESVVKVLDEKDSCDNQDTRFTILEFPPSYKNKQYKSLQLKSTTNFNKVCSVKKNHFEDFFESSGSDDDCHISDYSSPDMKSEKRPITSDLLDKRQAGISNNFKEEIKNSFEIVDFSPDAKDEVNANYKMNLNRRLGFRSKHRKKKKLCFDMTPALEIDFHSHKMRPFENNNNNTEEFESFSKSDTKIVQNSKISTNMFNDVEKSKYCENVLNSEVTEKLLLPCMRNINEEISVNRRNEQKLGSDDTVGIINCNESINLDVSQENNESLQIQSNTPSCSQVLSQYEIESVHSPSETSVFSDKVVQYRSASVNQECSTPSKLVHKGSVNWDELLDSGSKQPQKKYAENSLVGRICTVRNRYHSDIRLKRHMLSHDVYPQTNAPVFTVKKVWQEYSRYFLICYVENDQGCTTVDDHIANELYILTDAVALSKQNISSGTFVKVYPPW